MTVAIETRGLSKKYGRSFAVDNLNLAVEEGSVFVLAGRNGAGKSTAFGMLLGLIKPTAGDCRIHGIISSANGKTRDLIGYVPENVKLPYAGLRVAEYVRVRKMYYPSWDTSFSSRLTDILEIRSHSPLGTLSKGELRRVQLLLALSPRPPVLLLDEPTDGLDPIGRVRVLDVLHDYAREANATVLVATHLIYEMESFATHLGVMKKGRVLSVHPRPEIAKRFRRYILPGSVTFADPEIQVFSEKKLDDSRWSYEVSAPAGRVDQIADSLSAGPWHSEHMSFDEVAFALLANRVR